MKKTKEKGPVGKGKLTAQGEKCGRNSGKLRLLFARLGIWICMAAGLCGPDMKSLAKEGRTDWNENFNLLQPPRESVLPEEENLGEKRFSQILDGRQEKEMPRRIFRGMAESGEWKTKEYTRGKAVFILESSDSGAGLPERPYSFDGGKTWTADPEYEVRENGIYEARARDVLGNITRVRIVVDKIDNEAPEVDFAMEPDPWYGGKALVKVLARDAGAGLADRPYSFDGGNTWQFYGQIALKEPGEIRVMVRDAVGNRTEASYLAEKSRKEGDGDRGNEEDGAKAEEEKREEEKKEAESVAAPLEEPPLKRERGTASGRDGNEETGSAASGEENKQGRLPEEEPEQGSEETVGMDPYGQDGEEVYRWTHRHKLEGNLSRSGEVSRTTAGIELLSRLLLGKFFHTTMGSILLSVTVLASLLSLGSGILYLVYMRVRVYGFDGTGKYIYLGSVLLCESPEHLYVRIPENLWEKAVTDEYRLCPARLVVVLRRDQDLLVETVPDGRRASLRISRHMDCSLRKTWT